jgi:hypothetical protein
MSTLALLSPKEEQARAAAEADIRDGLSGFKKTGAALALIRDSRLYRSTHETFEAYVADEFGIVRSRAYQQIEAARVANELEHHGINVATESHAAALLKVEPEKRVQIFRQISEHGKVTAAAIEQAVKSGTETTTATPKDATKAVVRDLKRTVADLADAIEQLAYMPEPELASVVEDVNYIYAEIVGMWVDRHPAGYRFPLIEKTAGKINAKIEARKTATIAV